MLQKSLHSFVFFIAVISFFLEIPNILYANDRGQIYNIQDYGAVADGQTVNTIAIQKAIETCAANGGGTVVVPDGTFISGAVFLKQGVNLHIADKGILKGTTNLTDYPVVKTRWEGIERDWTAAFINAFDMNEVTIDGNGTIDGSGGRWVDEARETDPKINMEVKPTAEEIRQRIGRPRLMAIQNCKNVRISGLRIRNQACWGVFVLYSHEVRITGLSIRARHDIPMSDGIDIDSSTGILISKCTIDVNDDCIAIKSGKDEDGRRVNRPAENIIVEKCDLQYGHGGVSMGSEMSGGIKNVMIRNCVVEADNWAPIRFKSQPSRGGVVENITYRNLVLNNTRKAFEFNMEWRMVNPRPPSDPLPVVRNVKIINVRGTVGTVGDMHGLDESPIRNVEFKNCHLKAKTGFKIENVENIDLSGLSIEVENGPEIIRR